MGFLDARDALLSWRPASHYACAVTRSAVSALMLVNCSTDRQTDRQTGRLRYVNMTEDVNEWSHKSSSLGHFTSTTASFISHSLHR